MGDLIAALTIFAKYQEPTRWPTICSHDKLTIVGVGRDVSDQDAARLDELGFTWDEFNEAWVSFRFGSA